MKLVSDSAAGSQTNFIDPTLLEELALGIATYTDDYG
jgi:hypothetical protein